jgi:hypothetical protein
VAAEAVAVLHPRVELLCDAGAHGAAPQVAAGHAVRFVRDGIAGWVGHERLVSRTAHSSAARRGGDGRLSAS